MLLADDLVGGRALGCKRWSSHNSAGVTFGS